jgi:hypothetical protein
VVVILGSTILDERMPQWEWDEWGEGRRWGQKPNLDALRSHPASTLISARNVRLVIHKPTYRQYPGLLRSKGYYFSTCGVYQVCAASNERPHKADVLLIRNCSSSKRLSPKPNGASVTGGGRRSAAEITQAGEPPPPAAGAPCTVDVDCGCARWTRLALDAGCVTRARAGQALTDTREETGGCGGEGADRAGRTIRRVGVGACA